MKTLSLHKPVVLAPEAPHRHESVMMREVIELLAPADGEIVVDATTGSGGHSEALLSHAQIQLIALDADPAAVVRAGERLKRFGARTQVFEAKFGDLEIILKRIGIKKIHKVLFDLGWSTTQRSSGRGFSFMHDEPLLMHYGRVPASGFTAADILNTWSEKAIADVLYGYGEERYARMIARAVVTRRAVQKIKTTIELVEVIRDAVPRRYRHGRIHFATRTFQALRVAVNDELKQLEEGVESAWNHLSCGGRIAVISFHSTEDRIVKKLFAAYGKKGNQLLSKKPIVAGREEVLRNPSARSAKLRGIEKTCPVPQLLCKRS